MEWSCSPGKTEFPRSIRFTQGGTFYGVVFAACRYRRRCPASSVVKVDGSQISASDAHTTNCLCSFSEHSLCICRQPEHPPWPMRVSPRVTNHGLSGDSQRGRPRKGRQHTSPASFGIAVALCGSVLNPQSAVDLLRREPEILVDVSRTCRESLSEQWMEK